MTQSSENTAGATPPNLVIVFPDQMRGQALGFLNEDPVVTPHLDRFASESLVLPQTVANYPVCSPFRGMFMTGMYPPANPVISNCNSRTAPFGCELPANARCWSDVLKERGYSLGYIGKWHLDAPHEPYIDCKNNHGPLKWNEWCPPERRHGFDFWYAYGTYDHHLKPMYWSTEARRDEFRFVDQWGPEHEADLAIEYIRNTDGAYRKSDQPFALVVSMNPPHTPYDQYPSRYLTPYQRYSDDELLARPNVDKSGQTDMSRLALSQTRHYFANITGVDEQFGRIVQAIDEAGLGENTIVLFTSDHGNCVGIHNQGTKNNPFEESMRVPFLIRWPGHIPARRDNLLFSTPDLYPTLLDLLGFKDDIPNEVQGVSHANLFMTGQGKRPSSQLYLKIPHDNPAGGLRGVRTPQYKLILNADPAAEARIRLYDLQADPYEMSDIAAGSRRVTTDLIEHELRPWLARNNDPWLTNLVGNSLAGSH